MGGATYASVGTYLTKKIFEGDVVRQMSEETHLLNKLRKTSIELGTDVTNVVETSTPQGIGARGDRSPLPRAGASKFQNPVWDTIMQYIRISVTGKTWRRTMGQVRAFAPVIGNAVKEAILAYNRELEFQVNADGTDLRFVSSGAASVSGTDVTLTAATGYNVRGCFEGMYIDIYDSAGVVLVSGVEVTAVDAVNGTITYTDPASTAVATGAYVYREGNKTTGVINGLDNLINNSAGAATVLGLSSSLSFWQSTVFSNLGTQRAMTRDLLDDAYVTAEAANGKAPTALIVDYKQYKNLLALHSRPEIFANSKGKGMQLDLHNEVPMFGDAEVIRTNMGKPGNAVFAQLGNLEMKENTKLDWMYEPDGKNIWHHVQGYDEYEAVAVHDAQLILRRRNLHCRITDLTL